MKKSIIFLLSCILILSSAADQASAQKRKKNKGKKEKTESTNDSGGDEKTWGKKKDALDPMKFKEMVEGYQLMKREQGSLKRQAEVLSKQTEESLNTLKAKEAELAEAEAQLEQLQKAGPRPERDVKKLGASPTKNDDYKTGLVFKVQMGAYQKLNLDLTEFNDHGTFFVKPEENGFTKYTIGQFRDYKEAHRFRIYISEMGLKNPFVVAFQDGERVEDMKSVVEKPFEEIMDEILNDSKDEEKADPPATPDDE